MSFRVRPLYSASLCLSVFSLVQWALRRLVKGLHVLGAQPIVCIQHMLAPILRKGPLPGMHLFELETLG